MSNNKFKVLIIEDEANIRSFVQTILETNGYQVLTAATCDQGIMMFSSHIPDIVIFTGLMLKSLYEIALNYGFEYEDEKEKRFVRRYG